MIVSKLNESYLRIECEPDVAMELSESFSFLVEGYKFMPAYRMGRFDGYIRLFNLGTRTLPVGLFNKLKEFADQRSYEIEVKKTQFGEPGETANISYEDIENYITSLGLASHPRQIAVRDYQIAGAQVALNNYRCILNAATGCMDPNTEIDVELDESSMQELLKMRKLSV